MEKKEIERRVEDIFGQIDNTMVVTNRIKDGLSTVIERKIQAGDIKPDSFEKDVKDFLSREKTIRFIRERQPEISKVDDKIIMCVKQYFEKNLPEYTPIEIFRSSNHPDDAHLYSVVSRKEDGVYACWTKYNADCNNLNHGHYGLSDRESAEQVLREYFHDISDQPEQYGIECSKTEVECAGCEQREAQVIPFRQRRGR